MVRSKAPALVGGRPHRPARGTPSVHCEDTLLGLHARTTRVRIQIDLRQLEDHSRLSRTRPDDVPVRSNLATARANTDTHPKENATTTVADTRRRRTEAIVRPAIQHAVVPIIVTLLGRANLPPARLLEKSDALIPRLTTSYHSWQVLHDPKKPSLVDVGVHQCTPVAHQGRLDRILVDLTGRTHLVIGKERGKETENTQETTTEITDAAGTTTEEVAAITTTEENAIATSANQTLCTIGADLLGNLCLVPTKAAASPYYQQNYPPPAASPYYQAQQPPPHYTAPPPASVYPPQPSYRGPPSRGFNGAQRAPVPTQPSAAPASRGGRGGHFSNLSWTPSSGSRGGKVVSKRETSISGTETPLAPGSTTESVDDDDNPFRPPKDLRAEDESEKRKSGISFSIKGMAGRTDPSAPHKPAPLAAPRTRKEIVVRKRLKPKPKLTGDFATSDSVYYRKTGNESVVGSGTYGKVYKAVHVYTGDKVALKKIRMEGERDGFPVTAIREIKLLQSLNHTNVVKLQEVMVERNDCFMIFEYLSHDLTGLLNHPSFVLTEGHKKDLAKQLFEGLDYLHKRGVLHRDIKAANILVSRNGELKLADFGLARFYNKNAKLKQDYTNRVITIWYRSPELLLGETQYGPAVDIWSAACVLVEIFTKHAIFPGDGGEINQLDKIYNVLGTPSRSHWPGIVDLAWYELLRPAHKVPSTFAEKYQERVSPAAFDLLSAMFVFDPDTRPTASDVLEHPYFTTEEPKANQVVELKDLEGDWHEFESKALRKEKEREARRKDKESMEKRKLDGPVGDERELKRVKTGDAQA
ncbi:Pkinase-domain-containing protein [Aureobasidium sp. EXF-3400]|nr:Pkinase-domain-containing protein [Aureobasidium sp. EXF-12344]KAI4773497.1 Pkinase-domain-containing protein [Aureobasidium sp. EXF-3400]